MKEKIRLSTCFLGSQIFSTFLNPTGWDSIGFSFPIWIFYIGLRMLEKRKQGKLYIIKGDIWGNISPLIIWIVLVFFNMFVFHKNSGVFRVGFYYIVGALFCMAVLDAKLNRKELQYIISIYTLWGVIGAAILLIQRVPVSGYNNRYTIQIIGKAKDPNYFSAYLMFPCLLCWNEFISSPKTIVNALFGSVITVAIFLTGSRASFLALCVGICIVLFSNISFNKKTLKALVMGGVFFVTFLCVLPENLRHRFVTLQSYNDGSNRLRYNAWEAAVRIWKVHPAFGAGINAGLNYGFQFGGWVQMMTHNSYLDVLCEMGIIGFLPFLIFQIKLIKKALRKRSALVLAGLTTLFITGVIISAQYAQHFWFNLSLFYSILRIEERYKNFSMISHHNRTFASMENVARRGF